MSERAIQVGDLVVVVKPMPCCGAGRALGKIVHIVERPSDKQFIKCLNCNARRPFDSNVLMCSDGKARRRHRLRLIPPMSELEGEQRKEEIAV